MDASAKSALDALARNVGLECGNLEGRVDIVGTDPVVPGRHKLGTANAIAAAVQAATVAEIWKLRTGRDQRVSVDIRRAAYPGLCSYLHMRQNGTPVYSPHAKGVMPRNFFPTKDGRRFYVLRTTNYIQHCMKVHAFLGATTTDASVSEAVAQWNALELEQALAEKKLVGVIARTREEWLAHPQGALLAAKPPVEIVKIGESAARPLGPCARPLGDLNVIDMAHVLAGPITSKILAEQGAEVLRVSANHQPDDLAVTLDTSFGKRHAYLDLDTPGDVEKIKALIRSADVLVESWRPGALGRRGFSAEEVAAIRPGIIYVSVSCYGDEGPWGDRGGYDPQGQAVSGLSIAEGSAEFPKVVSTFTLNDYLTAFLAAAGVGGALLRRAREGGSYHVKASLTRSSMWLQSLGRLPESQWSEGPDGVKQFPAIPESDFHETQSAFGALRYPGPIAQFSETKGYWSRMPEPAGASAPVWLQEPTSAAVQ